jgi:hypothetical protein
LAAVALVLLNTVAVVVLAEFAHRQAAQLRQEVIA